MSIFKAAACFSLAAFSVLVRPGLCLGGAEALRASGNAFSLPMPAKPLPYALPGKPLAGRAGTPLPPEVAAKLPELGIALDGWDLLRIEEVYNFWRQAGPALWPGVTGIETTPIELVFPKKYDVLIGHPRPPSDCRPFSDRLPAERFCYRLNRSLSHSSETKPVNGVSTVLLHTLGSMDEYGAQSMATPGYRYDYLANAATHDHELFHAFQYREQEQLPKDPDSPGVSRTDYPSTNPELNMLLGVEARVLADALDASGPALAELVKDLLALRAERYSRLTPGARRAAGHTELIEGTAQYISYSVRSGFQPGLAPLPETFSDPRFAGYSGRDAVGEALKPVLKMLHRSQVVNSCAFAYHSGAALAFTLDRLDPGWKDGLFRTCSGKDCSLDTLLGRRVQADNTAERLARVLARYDAPALLAETRAELAELLAKNRKLIEDFRALPGRRYRLVFPGTPADGVGLVAPARLAEYGDERLFLDGCYGVQYARGFHSYDVDARISAPVLMNVASGEVELVLPVSGPAWPEIKAGRVYQSGVWTVYEEGVSVGGGVFKWNGDRLAVSERDGEITLAFYPKL
jgi:hypothetical protein